jgi:hypothetical protein
MARAEPRRLLQSHMKLVDRVTHAISVLRTGVLCNANVLAERRRLKHRVYAHQGV